jgi:RAB protein geranylgeranyltransferase component A
LHLDKNSFYGGASACCDLARLQEAFGGAPPDEAMVAALGNPAQYYVDQARRVARGRARDGGRARGAHVRPRLTRASVRLARRRQS